MKKMSRSHGVLLHPSSLPSQEGIGGLGSEAHSFLYWLHDAGARAWQMLPLVPSGAGYSPYSSPSAFAGNPLLISLSTLASQAWLSDSDLQKYIVQAQVWGIDEVDFAAVSVHKHALLNLAAQRFQHALSHSPQANIQENFTAFCQAESSWLDDAAFFHVLSHIIYPEQSWWDWPKEAQQKSDTLLSELATNYASELLNYKIIQYWFQEQWQSLKLKAEELNITLIGDVPIYVDHHSADVWAHPELFRLDKANQPISVAGVPPDAFSETGQLWGNPIYKWSKHLGTGYAWWVARLQRVLSLTHQVRIDHFRAFASYWSIPYGSDDARSGTWIKGPGMSIFEAFEATLCREDGTLPLIAEDLGLIDQEVRDLLESSRLPGMKVLQFAFDKDPENTYLPHNFTSTRCIVYTGTHDNDTSRGWWQSLDEESKHQVRVYCSTAGTDEHISWDLIRLALASIAELSIIPLQDVLSLGNNARMNKPSSSTGNWAWRVRKDALNSEVSTQLKAIAEIYGRC